MALQLKDIVIQKVENPNDLGLLNSYLLRTDEVEPITLAYTYSIKFGDHILLFSNPDYGSPHQLLLDVVDINNETDRTAIHSRIDKRLYLEAKYLGEQIADKFTSENNIRPNLIDRTSHNL